MHSAARVYLWFSYIAGRALQTFAEVFDRLLPGPVGVLRSAPFVNLPDERAGFVGALAVARLDENERGHVVGHFVGFNIVERKISLSESTWAALASVLRVCELFTATNLIRTMCVLL